MARKPTLDRIASEVNAGLDQVGYGFDPMVIITIITTLIGLFKDCKFSPAQARARALNPGFLGRLKLRRTLRQHGIDDEDAMEAALDDVAERLTTADMAALYEEV